jgi:hypothetical protein
MDFSREIAFSFMIMVRRNGIRTGKKESWMEII